MPSKKARSRSASRLYRQYAALPVRSTPDGQAEIMLVTTRGSQRWIIPKGWPMRKLSPSEAAAQEAYEEAGLEGNIETEQPIGSYRYEKRLPDGNIALIEVSIFILQVARQLAAWPEQAQRRTCWFDPATAAAKVEEPELAEILRQVQVPQPIPA